MTLGGKRKGAERGDGGEGGGAPCFRDFMKGEKGGGGGDVLFQWVEKRGWVGGAMFP